jgi:hypothetical protein
MCVRLELALASAWATLTLTVTFGCSRIAGLFTLCTSTSRKELEPSRFQIGTLMIEVIVWRLCAASVWQPSSLMPASLQGDRML